MTAHNRNGRAERAYDRLAIGAAEPLLALVPLIAFPGLAESTSWRRKPIGAPDRGAICEANRLGWGLLKTLPMFTYYVFDADSDPRCSTSSPGISNSVNWGGETYTLCE